MIILIMLTLDDITLAQEHGGWWWCWCRECCMYPVAVRMLGIIISNSPGNATQ